VTTKASDVGGSLRWMNAIAIGRVDK